MKVDLKCLNMRIIINKFCLRAADKIIIEIMYKVETQPFIKPGLDR